MTRVRYTNVMFQIQSQKQVELKRRKEAVTEETTEFPAAKMEFALASVVLGDLQRAHPYVAISCNFDKRRMIISGLKQEVTAAKVGHSTVLKHRKNYGPEQMKDLHCFSNRDCPKRPINTTYVFFQYNTKYLFVQIRLLLLWLCYVKKSNEL